jgi:ABC-type Zn uptake system ZnuABC Zn-binding protein ZnuA
MGLDPHVWFDPNSILVWVGNISSALEKHDPERRETYLENAEAYNKELKALDSWIREQVETISVDDRELVTDHNSLGYFARQYQFEHLGSVIPASTTEAETSGLHLADLIDSIPDHQTKAIFIGIDFDPSLARQVSDETGIELVTLYFGSLSDGPPAETYLEFMRYNVSLITAALKE